MNSYSTVEMGSGNATAESNRCSLRRIARHEEPEFSNASILNSMEKFVRTVNEMEETILVPSRLLDLSVGDDTDTICQKAAKLGNSSIKDSLSKTDLYRLYNIVNQMKVELLWSQDSTETLADDSSIQVVGEVQRTKSQVITQEYTRLGHARCPSTTSVQSVQSALSVLSSTSSVSDSDSDIGIENDSGMESEDQPSARLVSLAAENFRRHLRGLHCSIIRMTEAAEYLTLRYQVDVGGQV